MNTSSPLEQLRFRPEEIEISANSPFANDKLERQPFVTATAELLAAIQEPFVIALNAPWGSGKSTTFKLLEKHLASKDIFSVSFNAWEVDYATDPLVPLVATLHERLLEIKGYGKNWPSEKIERLKKIGGVLAKVAAVSSVKVATAGLLDLAKVSEEVASVIEKASEDLAGDVIDVFKQEKAATKKFSELLEEITDYVRSVTEDDKVAPPVVLLIDELDRCRPTFAVAMLERIKHFFSVPGLVFVLALDLEQLKASTRKVYGAEMDATEYLRRFIDLELRLPRADVGNMVQAMLSNCGANAYFNKFPVSATSARNLLVGLTRNLANNFDLPPRVVQRLITRLMLVLRQTPNNAPLDPTLAIFLIFLRMSDEGLYRKFVTGRVSAQEVMTSVAEFKPDGKIFYESRESKFVEALLICARMADDSSHHEHDFFEQFRSALNAQASANASQKRIRSVGDYVNGHRANGDPVTSLKLFDRRINLVSSDFEDTD